jgi:hypothetical protein
MPGKCIFDNSSHEGWTLAIRAWDMSWIGNILNDVQISSHGLCACEGSHHVHQQARPRYIHEANAKQHHVVKRQD